MLHPKQNVFIFDLDDTLMWNNYNYDLAKIEFLKWLIKVFKRRVPSSAYILHLNEEVDKKVEWEINPETGQKYGFTCQRFPTSLARTYRALCEEGWGEYNPILAEEVYGIGLMAFDPEQYRKAGLAPGAEEVLNYLKWREVGLRLLTKGDPSVQNHKIKALQLQRWFDDFHIVDDKDADLFRSYEGSNKISVGNSFSSDIKPALEAGCGAIFIPCYTWSRESIEVEKLPEEWQKKLWQIKKIEEIIPLCSYLKSCHVFILGGEGD